MLKITITELRKNFDYYLSLANKEEIYVTKYGKTISVMTPPEQYLKLQAILKKHYKDVIRGRLIYLFFCLTSN